jgi:hypothetical protein
MTYESLLRETIKALPEFKEKYNKSINDGTIDAETGAHIVFGVVFTPLLKKAIMGNKTLAKKMFRQLEIMAESEDDRVQEVCDQSVLEAICDVFPVSVFWPMAGEETRDGIKAISQYMNITW